MSLWKGSIDSHRAGEFCPGGKGESPEVWGFGVGWGSDWQGHASPSVTPLIVVRDEGQMDAMPSIRTFQSTGRGTMGIDEACVEGWESKYSSHGRLVELMVS